MFSRIPSRYFKLVSGALIVIALFGAFGLQYFSFETSRLYDSKRWGNQAFYVQTGNPEQFNWEAAYGHPGGTLIQGTSIVQYVTKRSYEDSLVLFLSLANALTIVGICIVTYLLRHRFSWSLVTFLLLTLNPLYLITTPPSALASLLTVLLGSVTLLLYERKDRVSMTQAIVWGGVAGLLCVTRIDIGVLASAVFGILLFERFWFRQSVYAFIAALGAFIVMNPFMWFMPLQHVYDLTVKVYQHIALISLEHPTLLELVDAGSIAALGVVVGVCVLVRRTVLPEQLPKGFLYALLVITGVVGFLYAIAENQAIRYLQPVIYLWEWAVPLMLLVLIDRLPRSAAQRTGIRGLVLFLFILYPVLVFALRYV